MRDRRGRGVQEDTLYRLKVGKRPAATRRYRSAPRPDSVVTHESERWRHLS